MKHCKKFGFQVTLSILLMRSAAFTSVENPFIPAAVISSKPARLFLCDGFVPVFFFFLIVFFYLLIKNQQ